jgi:hypothetical protein
MDLNHVLRHLAEQYAVAAQAVLGGNLTSACIPGFVRFNCTLTTR